MNSTKTYNYFISGQIVKDGQTGSFNMELIRNEKISDIYDIKQISRDIEKEMDLPLDSIIILNFQLFDK